MPMDVPPGLLGRPGYPPYRIVSFAKRSERDENIPTEARINTHVHNRIGNVLDIPQKCGVLSPFELRITDDYDATGLLERIHSGELSCETVIKAFSKRAMIALQVTNCISETFLQDAFNRAEYLDNYFRIHNRLVGPLHGLPIAVDDSFNIEGRDTTQGLTANAFQPAEKNSNIIDLLLELGAVLYVKTVVPQSMLVPETDNYVFGRAKNPYHSSFTGSGSCGGLASLIAMRGSLFGLALNVNGSIRLSAFCNGLYAITPSSGRIPTRGVKGYLASGAENVGISSVIGALGVSLRDCDKFLRALSGAQPWLADPTAAYLPWREPHLPDNLVIGIIPGEPEMTLLPPLQRILEGVSKSLKDARHEVVNIELFKCAELMTLAGKLLGVDGGMALNECRESTKEPYTWSAMYGGYLPSGTPASVFDMFSNSLVREDLQQEWLDYWESSSARSVCGRPMDAIICPPQSFLPKPHHIMADSVFPRFWDILDYPVSIVRCGAVEKVVDDVPLPRPQLPLDNQVQSLYSGEVKNMYEEFPLAIQVVTRRQREERSLAIAKVIEDLVSPSLKYPQAQNQATQRPSQQGSSQQTNGLHLLNN